MGAAHLTEGLPSPGTHSRSQAFLEQVYLAYSEGGSGLHDVSKEASPSSSLTSQSVTEIRICGE